MLLKLTPDGQDIEFDDFSPGTLVEVKYSGSVAMDEAGILKKITVDVEAKGKMIKGDPKQTAFGRLVSTFL